MDVEDQGQLPFLKVFVYRKEDGSVGHKVYRKPTESSVCQMLGVFTIQHIKSGTFHPDP